MTVRRASRLGFSLVEVMIALMLAGLMLAAAFELHITFNRQSIQQQKIAEMQQNLRVAKQTLERAIRGAGLGLQGGAVVTPGCQVLYPIDFHENNAYPAGARWGLGNAGTLDADPDWIRMVSTADTGPLSMPCPSGACAGTQDVAGASFRVACKENFVLQDWVVVTDSRTLVPPLNKVDCIYPVTVNPPGAACGAGCTCAQLTLGIANGCNLVLGGATFACNAALPPIPAPVRLLSRSTQAVPTAWAPVPALTTLRVERLPAGGGGNPSCTNPPCLMAAYTPLSAPPANNAAASWQLVVENVEDMQFAFILGDTGNVATAGKACGAMLFAVDDPAVGVCDPRRVKAVRFSVTVRSSSTIPGFNLGEIKQVEDSPAVLAAALGAPGNQFLRRTVTAEVQLRNNP
ncbi:MAG: prepilin-type N-terminal cleavage/methylation domain-containing protein [Myxococcales bacterium]|nr:prepilin-type N-terminal cleavage/methylation domain-containing protein [Myxococcales bacterium]